MQVVHMRLLSLSLSLTHFSYKVGHFGVFIKKAENCSTPIIQHASSK